MAGIKFGLRLYWATENDFFILMTEVFDNPWRDWVDVLAHEGIFGWWYVSINKTTKKLNAFRTKILGVASRPAIKISKTNATKDATKGRQPKFLQMRLQPKVWIILILLFLSNTRIQ